MNNVYDICSGEKIKLAKPKKRRNVETVIDFISQRKHQVDEIMIIFVEKVTGDIKCSVATSDEYTSRALLTYLDDHVRGSDIDS